MTGKPLCPVTGVPAKRLVQWVSAGLLIDLWRHEFKVDVRPSFNGVKRFGLWESPNGLYFFDPAVEGDAAFYTGLYNRMKLDRLFPSDRHRGDCLLAARHVAAGDRVLDVGCGIGMFRHLVPNARYQGLDPNFSEDAAAGWVRAESLSDHLNDNAGAYDVACAFQVLEHVRAPLDMLADMARAVRPGGKVIIGVPHVPSAHTRIPNFLINIVPHHLTWWTEAALKAAAKRVGLENASVQVAPWSGVDSLIYWIDRCGLVRCRTVHFRHSWWWHISALLSLIAGFAMWKLRPVPGETEDEGAALVLIATVPREPRP